MRARSVLMVDDDAAWCAEVYRFLEPSGYHVIAASSASFALQSLNENLPSAIFVEPNTVGPAFCEALRKVEALHGVPIFVISAEPARDVYDRGATVNGYARKAVALDHLMLLLGDGPNDGASRRRAA